MPSARVNGTMVVTEARKDDELGTDGTGELGLLLKLLNYYLKIRSKAEDSQAQEVKNLPIRSVVGAGTVRLPQLCPLWDWSRVK